jgi:hypothetical protein
VDSSEAGGKKKEAYSIYYVSVAAMLLLFFVAIIHHKCRFTAILSHLWPQRGAKRHKTRLLRY